MRRTDIHVGFALSKPSRLVSFCQNLSRRAHLVAKGQKETGPCFGSGPGDRPHSSFFISLKSRGMAHRQGAGLDRQAEGLVRFPGLGVKHHAPRLAVQRGIFGLRPQSAIGPHQELCLPGRRAARGSACVSARPHVCRSRSPSHDAFVKTPSTMDRDSDICSRSNFTVKNNFTDGQQGWRVGATPVSSNLNAKYVDANDAVSRINLQAAMEELAMTFCSPAASPSPAAYISNN